MKATPQNNDGMRLKINCDKTKAFKMVTIVAISCDYTLRPRKPWMAGPSKWIGSETHITIKRNEL